MSEPLDFPMPPEMCGQCGGGSWSVTAQNIAGDVKPTFILREFTCHSCGFAVQRFGEVS